MRSTLLLASFLAVVPIISAIPTRRQVAQGSSITFKLSVPVTGGDFVFQGCLIDSPNARLLTHDLTPSGGVTPEICMAACHAQNFNLGGVENGGRSCFCDTKLNGDLNTLTVNLSDCGDPCSGDPEEACGAFNRLFYYEFENS